MAARCPDPNHLILRIAQENGICSTILMLFFGWKDSKYYMKSGYGPEHEAAPHSDFQGSAKPIKAGFQPTVTPRVRRTPQSTRRPHQTSLKELLLPQTLNFSPASIYRLQSASRKEHTPWARQSPIMQALLPTETTPIMPRRPLWLQLSSLTTLTSRTKSSHHIPIRQQNHIHLSLQARLSMGVPICSTSMPSYPHTSPS